uniref:Uncharacterized protein n=1 Tax=Physcomitrium patens TaxID=3218 RepID=A0A7I4AA77_PHYPA
MSCVASVGSSLKADSSLSVELEIIPKKLDSRDTVANTKNEMYVTNKKKKKKNTAEMRWRDRAAVKVIRETRHGGNKT